MVVEVVGGDGGVVDLAAVVDASGGVAEEGEGHGDGVVIEADVGGAAEGAAELAADVERVALSASVEGATDHGGLPERGRTPCGVGRGTVGICVGSMGSSL